MSLQKLVEGDCGGVNPLIQFGAKFTQDAAHTDAGFGSTARNLQPDGQLVNEFLGQVAAPPQTFQMHSILQEMHEIEQANAMGPRMNVAPQINDMSNQWSSEYANASQAAYEFRKQLMQPRAQTTNVNQFFDNISPAPMYNNLMATQQARNFSMGPSYQPLMIREVPANALTENFFAENVANNTTATRLADTSKQNVEDWINDFQTTNAENEQTASDYNERFWQRLQEEWQKMSEDTDHPWLTDTIDEYEPYQNYEFAEENPMSDIENAFEKGKEYLTKGDIPSAVLCFEVAVKKDPDNSDIWEYLGMAQAENEMDPQSIAALKTSLNLKPDNPNVLMALAICYTNESLQNNAIQMLIKWLEVNPKYKNIVEQNQNIITEASNSLGAFSFLRNKRLSDTQKLFLEAVRLNPADVDPDVQEALGVLYNLSSEYDKAVDCFHAALQVNPNSAKAWNRLGASLANGSRSIEAVEAYQHALQLQPGFIRARYNVGVCCMNLKAYKEAAEHMLTALNMQSNFAALKEMPASANTLSYGQHQMSESIWSTLKMVLALMGRSDLGNYVNERNLAELNKVFKD